MSLRWDPGKAQALATKFGVKRLQRVLNSYAKKYGKFGVILRIETFTNDVSFFKHHRRVEHRAGTYSYKTANMRETIYSLPDLAELMRACNRRYLDFLSAVDDPTNWIQHVNKISRPFKDARRSYRGFNLFSPDDEAV